MHHHRHFHLQIKKLLIVFLVVLIITLLIVLGKENAVEEILSFMKANYFLGMFMYIVYTIVSVIIIPLPVLPLWPLASYLYGFWLGVILTTLGIVLGSSVTFLLARNFGKAMVIKMIGKHLFGEVEQLTNINNPKRLFLLRLFGNNYFDTISYAVGLSKIPFFTYFTITTITTGIWTAALFALIQKAGGLDNIKTFLSLMTGYAVLILLGTFAWEIYHKIHLKK